MMMQSLGYVPSIPSTSIHDTIVPPLATHEEIMPPSIIHEAPD